MASSQPIIYLFFIIVLYHRVKRLIHFHFEFEFEFLFVCLFYIDLCNESFLKQLLLLVRTVRRIVPSIKL